MDFEKLKRLALNDEGFIFDPLTGHSFVANPTARVALDVLRGTGDREAAARTLADQFDVSVEQAQFDVDEFLSQLALEKLI